MTKRTELVHYTKIDLEMMAKFAAMSRLVGVMYVGTIGEQTVRWLPDGTCEVLTEHTPNK